MANELEKAEIVQEVAELYLQGHSAAAIARMKGLSPGTVKNYVSEWERYIKEKAVTNPEMLDKVLENSIRFIESFNMMLSNAWEVHNEAKDAGAHATRLSALKIIQEITAQQARLHQLLGPRVDTNYLEKAKRAERVNELLSEILRGVVAECDRCYPLAWERLGEAFSIMDKDINSARGELSETSEES